MAGGMERCSIRGIATIIAMRNAKRVILGAVAALGAGALAWVVIAGSETKTAAAQGVAWQDVTIDEALARAGAEGKRVLVKFDATWCSYCRALDAEILSTEQGAELTDDLVAVHFDFDAEENRPLIERYVVLGLPTSLILTPDGTEIARIVGYDDRDDWIAQLRAAKTAEDPMPGLRAAFDAAPDDPAVALELGKALLSRGSAEEGEALLERVTWTAGDAPEAGAEALFVLGRYYQRVRRDPRTARHVFRELAARYPESEWAAGAWSWYAKAEAELGHAELGALVLRRQAEAKPDDAETVGEWGDYVAEHRVTRDLDAVRAALEHVTPPTDPEDAEQLRDLRRRLAAAGAHTP